MGKNINNFMVRSAELKDPKRIWEIRNQPSSRKYSGNPERIPFERHAAWFSRKYFGGEDNHCFVLTDESGLAIGYCRLDFDDELGHYVISIALDADFHGKGLGGYFLNEALRQFHGEKNIFAEIHKDNIPSIKLFQKNSFKICREDEKNYYLKFTPPGQR